MSHTLSWFEERVGKTVKRTALDTYTSRKKISYRPIKDAATAAYLFDLQSDFISFEENKPRSHGYKKDKIDDPFESDKPVIRIHKLDIDKSCTSCEG